MISVIFMVSQSFRQKAGEDFPLLFYYNSRRPPAQRKKRPGWGVIRRKFDAKVRLSQGIHIIFVAFAE